MTAEQKINIFARGDDDFDVVYVKISSTVPVGASQFRGNVRRAGGALTELGVSRHRGNMLIRVVDFSAAIFLLQLRTCHDHKLLSILSTLLLWI